MSNNRNSSFNKNPHFLYNFLSIIGGVYLIRKSLNSFYFLKKYFLTKPKNFPEAYGDGWVFITGSSEGIGKSFAKSFATRGCNILLSSRNEEKLKIAAEEIKMLNKNIKVEYLVTNFNKNFGKSDIDDLKKNLEKYEINVLINNVGLYKMNFLEKIPDEQILGMINVNISSATLVTKICLEKMKKRNQSSLIVASGSDLILFQPPFSQVYTGTKSYIKSFLSCLEGESTGKIDFTYLNIGPVYTPSSKAMIPFKLDSDEFAEKSMSQLGNFSESHGHYLHAIKYVLFGNKMIYSLYTKHQLKKEFYPKN
jgi:short-subunit dehydrogenase